MTDDGAGGNGDHRGSVDPVHPHAGRPYDWVGAWSERRRLLSPDRVGLVDATAGERYTYADLDRRADRAARRLAVAGVGPGDRVAVVSRNRPAVVDLFFATGKTGSVLAPLSHRLAPRELAVLLDDVDPALVVAEARFADLAADALAHEVCDYDGPRLELPEGEVLSWDDDARASGADGSVGPLADPAAVPDPDLGLDDPHLLLHTGGSTGVPKETVLTHGSIVWNATNTITAWGLRADDVTPMVFPMFHTGGWNVLTVPLFHMGATVIVAREFEPADVLGLIDREGATVLVAVPAVLRMMCEHDDWASTDLSTLRFAKSGGGPCRESVMAAWWDRGVDLSQGYGLTECGPNNFAMPDGWPREKADSVGVPNLHVDVRIVDDDGRPVDAGEIGELELASPHAADRYWNNDAETASTFGGGWVSTGDLARRDGDGYVYIEGRKKNMYVSGGENVYPAEVENAVSKHPAVAEVVVIPVPDDRWGQVGKAVIEPVEGSPAEPPLTIEELRSFLEGDLAGYKHPRHVAFLETMPTSGPSKIDREAVKRRFGEAD